jgi:hypothetical protein
MIKGKNQAVVPACFFSKKNQNILWDILDFMPDDRAEKSGKDSILNPLGRLGSSH